MDSATSTTPTSSTAMENDSLTSDMDVDTLAERLYDKLVEQQGIEQSKMAKQGIQLLLASGLMEAWKEKQQSSSLPPSPNPAAPMVQSPAAMTNTSTSPRMAAYSDTSPMSSISSAASGSSYGMPNIRQQDSSTSSTSTYSPQSSAAHRRSFSSSSSLTSSPSLSSTPSLSRRKKALKILDVGTGAFGTISTLLTMMSDEGLIHSREELEITASELDKNSIEKLKERFKNWNHVKLRAYAPESIPATADTYSYAFHSMGMHWVRDEDSTLKETYRVLRPGGIAGFTSMQSIGYVSSGSEDPLKVLPNSGWSSPSSIHKKLSKHHFTDIQIYEYVYPHTFQSANKTWKDLLGFIMDGAIKKLWKDENNNEIDKETRCAMREQLMDMFKDGEAKGDIVALITLAKKPETSAAAGSASYF